MTGVSRGVDERVEQGGERCGVEARGSVWGVNA